MCRQGGVPPGETATGGKRRLIRLEKHRLKTGVQSAVSRFFSLSSNSVSSRRFQPH